MRRQSGHSGHNFESSLKMNVCDATLPSELKLFRFYRRTFHQIVKIVACLSSFVGRLLQAESSKTIREEHYQYQCPSMCVAELHTTGGGLAMGVKSICTLTSHFCEGEDAVLWLIAEFFKGEKRHVSIEQCPFWWVDVNLKWLDTSTFCSLLSFRLLTWLAICMLFVHSGRDAWRR
jgi:hypothetical protein